MRHDWMHRWRNALRAHCLPVTQMEGIPIHALRMMSFFGIPDAESQEEAINRFMGGLEQQEHRGFSQIDRLISSLPVPVLKKSRCMSHAQALEGGFCSFISSTFCSPYPQRPCGGRRLDNLWMCGMGVRFVQGHNACQMLSLRYEEQALPFLQSKGLSMSFNNVLIYTMTIMVYISINHE